MDNQERIFRNGVTIIKPKDRKKVPLDCEICGLAFPTRDDVLSFKTNGCCLSCDLIYRVPNLKKWNSGWRPIL